MRILVVEDEPRLADALKQIFEEKKYMVDLCENGLDGLEFARSGIYDVIILDVMLPKMDGFCVARELRASKNATSVLMLTAKDTIPDKVTGLDCGADDYMDQALFPSGTACTGTGPYQKAGGSGV